MAFVMLNADAAKRVSDVKEAERIKESIKKVIFSLSV